MDHPISSSSDPAPEVRVIRSRRRTKTSSARLVGGIIEVRLPAWLPEPDASATVEDLVRRIQRSRAVADGAVDLRARARLLAAKYGLPEPTAISWSARQEKRWGSCTPAHGTIRISTRLSRVPGYVLDAVIVHELAHLVEPGHGAAFKVLEERFPHRDRADGFLEAMSLGCADEHYVVP
jgi:predicted metal-dependent hydrolase